MIGRNESLLADKSLFQSAIGEFATLPRPALMVAAIVGAISSVSELLHWWRGPIFTVAGYIVFAVSVPLWLGAIYFSSMAAIGSRMRWHGFLRFIGAMFLAWLPILIGITSLILRLPSSHKNAVLLVSLALICVGWLELTMLPAWPVAQALSLNFVSPIRIARATHGHRWSLISVSLGAGILYRIVPQTSTGHNLGEATVLALGQGFISALTMMVFVAVGVTAWRYAAGNDPSLKGDMGQD